MSALLQKLWPLAAHRARSWRGSDLNAKTLPRLPETATAGQLMRPTSRRNPPASQWICLAIVLLALPASPLLAATPRLAFDTDYAVECRDVTPPEFMLANPGEKIVEARIRVSMLLERGKHDDLDEVMITFYSPQRRMRVIDFAPRTELASEYDGSIETTRTREKSHSVDARISGAMAGFASAANVTLGPTAGLATSELEAVKESYRRLPPLSVVLASGTVHGGHGVFFKLRGSPQNPLEGARDFCVQFAVPEAWRGDWAVLTAQARGRNRQFLVEKSETVGQTHVCVGLYLLGDEPGKHYARRLAELQGQRIASATEPTNPLKQLGGTLCVPNLFKTSSQRDSAHEPCAGSPTRDQRDPTEEFRLTREALAEMAW